MEEKLVYITKEVVLETEATDLDLDLDAEFCDSDEDRCVEICEDRNFLYTDVMKLSVLEEIIEKMKAKGADHIEIIKHVDHHGYEFYGSKIRLSTEAEISEYEEKKRKLDAISKEVMELESKIEVLRKKYYNGNF